MAIHYLPEAFDETLSTKVSLSRILDAFVIEEESPETIIAFLKQHDADFKAIISHSLWWPRLFQLDFLLQSKADTIGYLLKKLRSIPKKVAAFCCWQVLLSNSGIVQHVKYMFRHEISVLLDTLKVKHPYSGFAGRNVPQIDEKLIRACNQGNFVETAASLGNVEFLTLVSQVSNSVFKYRLMSLDVFECLDEVKKWMMISKSSETVEYFKWQILASTESDEVKELVLDCMKDVTCRNSSSGVDPYSEYLKCKTFSEMMLKSTLQGDFEVLELAKRLVDAERWDLLHDWDKYNHEELEEIFKISAIAEKRLKAQKLKKKKSK